MGDGRRRDRRDIWGGCFDSKQYKIKGKINHTPKDNQGRDGSMYVAIVALIASLFPVAVINEPPAHVFDVKSNEVKRPDEVVDLSLGCSAVLVGPNAAIATGSCYAKDTTFTFRQVEYSVRFYQSPALDISIGKYSPELPFGVVQFSTVVKADLDKILEAKKDHRVYVYTQKSKDFLDDMISVAELKICGLNYDCTSNTPKEKQSLWQSITY